MPNLSQNSTAAVESGQPRRSDHLPLIYQEVLTVVVRLRANRQRVGDPEVFRSQVRNALKTAEQEGLRYGYVLEDVRVATFAIVAFLDESILNSQNVLFADWPRKPLQEELYGIHTAGEIFFRNVDRLLARQDSGPLADLLEVHQLCLLLGFRGRFSATSGSAEIRTILGQIEEKIRRIRANSRLSAPAPAEISIAKTDQWVPILKWTAIGSVLFVLLLFVIFKLLLSSSAGELQSIAAGTRL
jgi:type VI secretion system protein ImpK